MKKVKKLGIYIIFTIIFLTGLTVFFYPIISDFIFKQSMKNEINKYESQASSFSNDECDRKINEAKEFNLKLPQNSLEKNNNNIQNTNYKNLLTIDNSGIMGYLKIDKLNVNLLIYHGSGKDILQRGIGHYEGSSFPIEGESVHAVLVGHTGLPTAKIISDLDKLQLTDTFEITILNKKYLYEVDQIKVVKPDEMTDLQIVEGKQYTTLVTCTPYGINSHRLLVRGKFVKKLERTENQSKIQKSNWNHWIIIIISIMMIMIGIIQKKHRKVRKIRNFVK